MKNLLYITIIFFNLNALHALELRGDFFQGNLIIGKIEPGSKIFIDKKEIKISDQGYFAYGLSKNRKNDVFIKVVKNGVSTNTIKKVFKKKYKIQKINGLPSKQVTPPKEFYERIKSDNRLIARARAVNSNLTYFSNSLRRDIFYIIVDTVPLLFLLKEPELSTVKPYLSKTRTPSV